MKKAVDKPFVQCNFCGVEHMQGDCLEYGKEDYKKWMELHGMRANINFYNYPDSLEVDDK